jgi:hypothetical protein
VKSDREEPPADRPATPLARHYANNDLNEHVPGDDVVAMFEMRGYPESVMERLRQLLSLPAGAELDVEAMRGAPDPILDEVWEVLLAHTMKLSEAEHARQEALLAACRERLEKTLSPEQIDLAAMVYDTSLLEEERKEARERFECSLSGDAETELREILGKPDAPKFENLLRESVWSRRRQARDDGDVEEEYE